MAVRTGLQTAIKLTRGFCKFLATWKPSVVAAINSSSLSAPDKATAIATLDAIESGCDVFSMLFVRWEK